MLRYCIALILCIGCAIPVFANDEVLPSLERWKSQADAIWSYDAYLSVEINAYSRSKKKMVKMGEHELRQRYLNGKWRVDFLKTHRFYLDRKEEISSPDRGIVAYAFNGKEVKFFKEDSNFGQVQELKSFLSGKLLAPQLYEMFKTSFYGETYFSILGYRSVNGVISEDDTRENVTHIRLPVTDDLARHSFKKIDFEVSFDESQSWLPVSIKYGDLSKKPITYFIAYNNKYYKFDSSIWAPAVLRKELYSKTIRGNIDEPFEVTELRVDLEKTKVNIDIHPDVFELAFPPGAVVYDAQKGENYIKSDGSREDYLGFQKVVLEKHKALIKNGNSGYQETMERERSSKYLSLFLIILNGVILMTIVVLFLRRRKCR